MFIRSLIAGLLVLWVSLCAQAQGATPIYFWHSMAGPLGEELERLTDQFNQSVSDYRVILVYKGNYNESLTSAVAAFRAHQQPAILQVFEVGVATMMQAREAVIPLYELLDRYPGHIHHDDFFQSIADYYSDTQRRLWALPFNTSTPVLFYNRTALAKLGFTQPPDTWPAFASLAKQLLSSGYHCGFTTAWPSWIQLEVFSAWHNLPIASAANGFEPGEIPTILFKNPLVLQHIQALATWQKEGIFYYGGRADDAKSLFTSGYCPMLFESSGSMISLKNNVPFELGVAPLPYWPHTAAPQNTTLGGAALWVMAGFSPEVYHGVSEFLNFLATPKVQAAWAAATGYVPTTHSAYRQLKSTGYYRRYPEAEVAVDTLNAHAVTPYSRGIRLGNYLQIRDINDAALEAVFSRQLTAEEALGRAQKQDNLLLQQFADQYSKRDP